MDDTKLKIRLLYTRFLVIFFSTLIFYSFLHWLLIIRLDVITIREDLVNIAIPILLPWIPLWLLLRKRVKLLKLKTRNGNLPALYLVIASLTIAAPVAIFQEYLITALGNLTALKTPDEIAQHKPVKYYTIEQYYVDKRHARLKRFSFTSGKGKGTLHHIVVLAVPLYASGKDTLAGFPIIPLEEIVAPPRIADTNTVIVDKEVPLERPFVVDTRTPPAWQCIQYDTSISNRIDWQQKNTILDAFYETSIADFNAKKLESCTYFDRPGNTKDRERYVQTVEGINYSSPTLPIILVPKYHSFEYRSGNKLPMAVLIFSIGALICLAMILIPGFDQRELKRFHSENAQNS